MCFEFDFGLLDCLFCCLVFVHLSAGKAAFRLCLCLLVVVFCFVCLFVVSSTQSIA